MSFLAYLVTSASEFCVHFRHFWNTPTTSSQKKKYEELEGKAKPYLEALRKYNMAEESIFEDTAESRARNKSILWWVLNMSYKEEDGKEVPFFGEGDFDFKFIEVVWFAFGN